MRRRDVICLLTGAALAGPAIVRAQQAARPRRIGVVMLYPENDPQGQLRSTAFVQQLEKSGWAVGTNLQVEFKWGTGDADWVRALIDACSGSALSFLAAGEDERYQAEVMRLAPSAKLDPRAAARSPED